MEEKLYRKKSLDSIQSPDNLTNYIRVSNPGVWLLLAAVIVLLAGALIWSIFGRVERSISTYVEIEDGRAECRIDGGEVTIRTGMKVRSERTVFSVTKVTEEDGDFICSLECGSMPEDGIYPGKLILESIEPISFIIGKDLL